LRVALPNANILFVSGFCDTSYLTLYYRSILFDGNPMGVRYNRTIV